MAVNQGENVVLPPDLSIARQQLFDRREKLERARPTLPRSDELSRLLRDVDAALERIDNGTYGLCEVCHDPVEPDRLAANPLVRYCLAHLTSAEQRALEQDLDLAGRVQHALLPKTNLSFGGWETCYHYEPLGPASGDYCDLITADDGDLLFLLGDVAGKGVAASVLMSHLHAIFRSLVSLQLPFEELMARANRIFCESTSGEHYATMVCGRADASGEVEICNAGHCPPLWVRSSEAISVPATGLPVGLFSSTAYSTTRLAMGRGESLLLYTDGVTEARDPSDAEYGTARLSRALAAANARGSSAADLVSACLNDLLAFRSAAPRTDDLTVLAIRRAA